MNILKREPVMLAALAPAIAAAVSAFGVEMTAEQATALIVAVAFIANAIARSRVSPVA